MNSMFKKVVVGASAIVLACAGYALDDRSTWVHYGENDFIGPFKIDGTEVTATASELNQLDTGSGLVTLKMAALASTVTNTQLFTPTYSYNLITSSGSAETYTNTMNLQNVSASMVGQLLYFVNVSTTTNYLMISNIAPVYARENTLLGVRDSVTFLVVATNQFYRVSKSITDVAGDPVPAMDGAAITNISAGGVTLAAGKLIIGNASGVGAAQTVGGVATVSTSGVLALTLAAGKVFVGNAAGAGAAQTIGGVGTLNTAGVFGLTLAASNLFIGNASGAGAAATITGDGTITTNGVFNLTTNNITMHDMVVTLYSGIITNTLIGTTNTIYVTNGLIGSVVELP